MTDGGRTGDPTGEGATSPDPTGPAPTGPAPTGSAPTDPHRTGPGPAGEAPTGEAPTDEAEALAALADAGRHLVEGVERALPDWADRSVADLLAAWGGPVDAAAVRTAARAAGARAAARIAADLRALFAQDPDEQRVTPLQIVRTAYRELTPVLVAAGVPEVVRDDYAVRAWPDDVYGLVVQHLRDLDQDLVPWQLVWGAAKATVMKRRHQL